MTVLASGPRNAKIAFVGMAPARVEVQTGIPFSGPSGDIFNRALKNLGKARNEVYVTNVHDNYLQPGTSLFSLPPQILQTSISRVANELQNVNPNVVVAMGDEPLKILCNVSGIKKWRGSILDSTILPGQKVVATVHPAWIQRGMFKWESVFTHIDLARAFRQSEFPEIIYPRREFIIGPSFNTVKDVIRECEQNEYLCFDIEVYGYTRQGTGEIACIGISHNGYTVLCIPLNYSGNRHYWLLSEEIAIWQALARLLQNAKIKKIGQNISFDWIYHWLHNVYPANMFIDTMLLHHTLYPDYGGTEDIWGAKRKDDEPGHGLAFIKSHYLDSKYHKDDGRRRDNKSSDEDFWRYNCEDVASTFEIAFLMKAEAEEEKVWDVYVDIHQRPFLHALRMEWFGLGIDTAKRTEVNEYYTHEMTRLQGDIDKKLGYKLNVASPKQLYKLLYSDMKLKTVLSRTTGKPTADKYVLRKYAEQTQDEVLLWIQELRQIRDLMGDIINQKLGVDNRMHTHYKQGGTDSNRWSSTKSILGTGTNLQNIPRDGIARKLFVAS